MPATSQPVPYAQVRPTLMTGDVLLFVGKSDNPLDYAIQFIEGEPFTHVGLVIRDGQKLYFWDAPGGGETFPDPYRNNKAHDGCRVADLDAVVKYYMTTGGEVQLFMRHITPQIAPAQMSALRMFIDVADGLPFPGEHIELPDHMGLGVGIAASYEMGKGITFRKNTLHLTPAGSYFCAQLAAESYMRMGLVAIAPRPANGYTPADFSSKPLARLPFQNGTSLGDTTEVCGPW